MQLTHYENKFTPKNNPIVIVCDSVSNPYNIGGIFRAADAFGVQEVIFCGTEFTAKRKIAKTARATQKVVQHQVAAHAQNVIITLKEQGYCIIALEITTKSKPIETYNFKGKLPVVLLIGAENFGITEALLQLADATLHITMYGNNSSMNVMQATSIALFEITKQIS